MTGPEVAGQLASERLMGQVLRNFKQDSGLPMIDAVVVATLHSLADHTALLAAMRYSPDNPDGPGEAGQATSMGRWLHAVADQVEGRTWV